MYKHSLLINLLQSITLFVKIMCAIINSHKRHYTFLFDQRGTVIHYLPKGNEVDEVQLFPKINGD